MKQVIIVKSNNTVMFTSANTITREEMSVFSNTAVDIIEAPEQVKVGWVYNDEGKIFVPEKYKNKVVVVK